MNRASIHPPMAHCPDEASTLDTTCTLTTNVLYALMVVVAISCMLPLPLAASPKKVPKKVTKTWDMPAPPIQMDKDKTLIPVGKGGIFVPCMTDPLLEPDYLVVTGDQVVAITPTGTTTPVDPGTYTVKVGSGVMGAMSSFTVTVNEGAVSQVLPFWSGLVIDVVDDKGLAFRGGYELLALPERTNVGNGFGAELEKGDKLKTWLLPPGLYMLIKTGETYQARKNFYTFRLRPGYLEKITLVMDQETGDFLGAGVAYFTEEYTQVSDWKLSAIIGGDLHLSYKSKVVGATEGLSLTTGFYLDSYIRMLKKFNYFYARLAIEESFTDPPNAEIQKTTDQVKFDAIYIYRLLPWLGPYVRAGVETTLFAGYEYFDSPTTILVTKDDGRQYLYPDQESFKLTNSFFPLTLKAGAGLSLDFDLSYVVDISMRFGIGGRQTLTGGLRVADDTTNGVITYNKKEDYGLIGVEGAVIAFFRFTRWVTATTEFEILEPFTDTSNPLIDWNNNIGLRIASFASINYLVSLKYDTNIQGDPQWDHRVMLRLSYKLF